MARGRGGGGGLRSQPTAGGPCHQPSVVGSVHWLGVLVMVPASLLMAHPSAPWSVGFFPQDRLRQVSSVCFLLVVGVRILL